MRDDERQNGLFGKHEWAAWLGIGLFWGLLSILFFAGRVIEENHMLVGSAAGAASLCSLLAALQKYRGDE